MGAGQGGVTRGKDRGTLTRRKIKTPCKDPPKSRHTPQMETPVQRATMGRSRRTRSIYVHVIRTSQSSAASATGRDRARFARSAAVHTSHTGATPAPSCLSQPLLRASSISQAAPQQRAHSPAPPSAVAEVPRACRDRHCHAIPAGAPAGRHCCTCADLRGTHTR